MVTYSSPSKEMVCAVCAQPWALGHRCKSTPLPSDDQCGKLCGFDVRTGDLVSVDLECHVHGDERHDELAALKKYHAEIVEIDRHECEAMRLTRWAIEEIERLRMAERMNVETVAKLQQERDELQRDIEADFMQGAYARLKRLQQAEQERDGLKAKIDALMLEFCPGEMSAEQRAEWSKNQRAPQCIACEDRPGSDNDPCLVCGRPVQPPSSELQRFGYGIRTWKGEPYFDEEWCVFGDQQAAESHVESLNDDDPDGAGPSFEVVELLMRLPSTKPATDAWPKCPTCEQPIYFGHECVGIRPADEKTESLSGGNPSEKSASRPADHRGIAAARSSDGGNGGQALGVAIQSCEPVDSNTVSVARASPEQIHAKDVDPLPSITVHGANAPRACGYDVGFNFKCRRAHGHDGLHSWDPKRLYGEDPVGESGDAP